MDPLHGIFVTLGLFMVTFLNPGANLLVVVQTTLSHGKRAGIACGCGVVLGNAIFSALGLFGLVALVAAFGKLMAGIKIVGGLYLSGYAVSVFQNRRLQTLGIKDRECHISQRACFRRGLLCDLSNPQSMLFFMSIFSVTLSPSTPLWAKIATWSGIIITSFIWRLALCHTFSRPSVRRGYLRIQGIAGKIIGVILGLFALRLIAEGVRPWLSGR